MVEAPGRAARHARSNGLQLDLVPVQTEAHTAGVIKIISVEDNHDHSAGQSRAASAEGLCSLELLECDRERTSLLAYVDGDEALYEVTANLVDQSKFAERPCVQGQRKEFSINTRRCRIALIHNEIHKLIKPCEYVFLIEDDGILPPDALSRLLADYQVGSQLVWTTPKTHQTRSVPVPGQIAAAIEQQCRSKQPGDLIFTSPLGKMLRLNNWRKNAFDPACKAAALVGLQARMICAIRQPHWLSDQRPT